MKNKDLILQFLIDQGETQYSILKQKFSHINETTLVRNLKKLEELGEISKRIDKRNTYYSAIGKGAIQKYLSQPFFERPERSYNFDFLKNYIPNTTSFLGDAYQKIQALYQDQDTLSTYDYLSNIRGIENLLIDLSYASSNLEGNTYSYLDTEILVKYNETAEGKTAQETQMIINHKNAIRFIIEHRNEIMFVTKDFFETHILLGKGLLLVDYLGCIRDKEVKIGGSTYTPLDNHFKLKEEFDLFLAKLNDITNPFEQSLFILVFIPYFQIFMDINKRTSRISANIPLIKKGLAPISLLQVKERDYINAVLAIYELNDPTLMRDIFVENYILNFKRYI
ncbi:Fic family protein [Candidatus Gracilibacteria bacterium]|nr:Fic family protein [Candidatus Gracilibacteria bacterium]